MGIPWTLGPDAAQFLPSRFVPGIILALLVLPRQTIPVRLGYGVIFGLAILSVNVLHTIGHTISAKLVGAPMDENRVRNHFIQNIYRNDPPDLPRRVHLGRTLGGPLMNIAVGLISLAAWVAFPNPALIFLAAAHLLNGILIMLIPARGFDGEIIWRELRSKDPA